MLYAFQALKRNSLKSWVIINLGMFGTQITSKYAHDALKNHDVGTTKVPYLELKSYLNDESALSPAKAKI